MPAPSEAEAVRDLFKRALVDGCGCPPRKSDRPDRVLGFAHELAWRVWYRGPDRLPSADVRAALEAIARANRPGEARLALAHLAVKRGRERIVGWARDEAFLLVATLARADLRSAPGYEARHDPYAALLSMGTNHAPPPEGTALAEATRWATLPDLSADVAGILASLRDRMQETDDEYCNRAEAVAAAIQAREQEDRAAVERAERRKAAKALLWLCHEVLRRVKESPVADVASVVGSCAGSMVHHAREVGFSGWGGEHHGPIECFAWLREAKDVPPLARFDFDRNPALQAMFVTELRDPFEGASQYLTGWLESETDAKRIVPDMKHGDLAAFRDGVLRVLPRYIRFLETKRFTGLLSKEEIAACAGPPPDGMVLPLRRRAPGEEPYRDPAAVGATHADAVPVAADSGKVGPAEPPSNTEEARVLERLRAASGRFVHGLDRAAVGRLKARRWPIESVRDARRRNAPVPANAKGHRLIGQ